MKSESRLYEVILKYNIDEVNAVKALDKILGTSAIQPISMSCEPIVFEDEEEYA